MDKIYLVSGSTGEYSDYTNWNVKTFKDVTKAEAFRDKLNELCVKAGVHDRNHRDMSKEDEENIKKLDPFFLVFYTGTTYGMEEIDFEDE